MATTPTGLLLLVDLDGVVYRGAEPVPGSGRGPRGAGGARRRRRLRDEQLDVVPRRVRHAPRRRWAPRRRGSGRLVAARDGALPRDHEPDVRRVLALGRGRARARAARRGLRGHDGRPRGDARESRWHRFVGGGRGARRGRRRARPAADVHAPRRRRGLHPGRRPLHRHEPRPGLSRPSAASGPEPAASSPRSRRRPA